LETNSLIRINEHLVALLDRRDSIRENELCRLLRSTAEVNKLEIIEPIGQKNVKLAVAVAVRVELTSNQQKILLGQVLARGRSNEIKQYVMRLFCCRFGVRRFFRGLEEYSDIYPKSVKLAAYYACSSKSFSKNRKEIFRRFLN